MERGRGRVVGTQTRKAGDERIGLEIISDQSENCSGVGLGGEAKWESVPCQGDGIKELLHCQAWARVLHVAAPRGVRFEIFAYLSSSFGASYCTMLKTPFFDDTLGTRVVRASQFER